MEFLEGETLAQRLQKGALAARSGAPLRDRDRRALDVAHCQGITHRDLKPGNIMLTKSGAKLLDFGLATSVAPGIAGADLSGVSTTPPRLTERGTILGTFQDMAPEQADGGQARRALRCLQLWRVLYEMVSGQLRISRHRLSPQVLSAVLRDDPRPFAGAAARSRRS